MFHQIPCDQLDAFRCADQSLQRGPFAAQALFVALFLLGLGDLLEFHIQVWLFRFIQLDPCQPALVVDGHRGAIFHSPQDVVAVDVVAEDSRRAAVVLLNGGAGKADEGGIWKGVVHVAGKAVDKVILAAVGLVGDHHDVAPL